MLNVESDRNTKVQGPPLARNHKHIRTITRRRIFCRGAPHKASSLPRQGPARAQGSVSSGSATWWRQFALGQSPEELDQWATQQLCVPWAPMAIQSRCPAKPPCQGHFVRIAWRTLDCVLLAPLSARQPQLPPIHTRFAALPGLRWQRGIGHYRFAQAD